MLGKLMKYDFMFSKTQFFVMAAGMIFGAALIRIFNLLDTGFLVALILVMTAIFVACIVLVYQHFNKNLFSGEGYLMLSLPVKRGNLIVSKLIVSLVWFDFMLVAGVITVLILVAQGDMLQLANISWRTVQNLLVMLVYLNLIVANGILLLFLMSTAANVSVGGRRMGGLIGAVFAAIVLTLEIAFGTKVLYPIMGDFGLMFYSGKWTLAATIPAFVGGEVMTFPFAPVLTMILFSAIAYAVTWYFLKKRVDLA